MHGITKNIPGETAVIETEAELRTLSGHSSALPVHEHHHQEDDHSPFCHTLPQGLPSNTSGEIRRTEQMMCRCPFFPFSGSIYDIFLLAVFPSAHLRQHNAFSKREDVAFSPEVRINRSDIVKLRNLLMCESTPRVMNV